METKALKRIFRTAFTFLSLLAVDVLIYGEIFPLLGLFCGIWLSAYFALPLVAQVFLVTGCTMILFFLALGLRIEVQFWRRLYRLEKFYKYVLYVRDSVNAVSLAIFAADIVTSSSITFATSSSSTTPPEQNTETPQFLLLENINPIQGFFFVFCQRLQLFRLDKFLDVCTTTGETPLDGGLVHDAIILHATVFIVTAVAKMLYFNTLFTYLQAVRMFHEIKPAGQGAQQRSASARRHVVRRRRHRPQNEPGGQAEDPSPNVPPGTVGPVTAPVNH